MIVHAPFRSVLITKRAYAKLERIHDIETKHDIITAYNNQKLEIITFYTIVSIPLSIIDYDVRVENITDAILLSAIILLNIILAIAIIYRELIDDTGYLGVGVGALILIGCIDIIQNAAGITNIVTRIIITPALTAFTINTVFNKILKDIRNGKIFAYIVESIGDY